MQEASFNLQIEKLREQARVLDSYAQHLNDMKGNLEDTLRSYQIATARLGAIKRDMKKINSVFYTSENTQVGQKSLFLPITLYNQRFASPSYLSFANYNPV
jgi:hypothetical protein